MEWFDPTKKKAPAGEDVLIAWGTGGSNTHYAVAMRRTCSQAYEMSNGPYSPSSLYPANHQPNGNANKVLAWTPIERFYYFPRKS